MITFFLATITASLLQSGVTLQEEWSFVATKESRLHAIDSTLGGNPVLYGGTQNHWFTMQYDSTVDNWRTLRSSRRYDDPEILSVEVADIGPNPGTKIVVFLRDGSFEIVDQTTLQVLFTGTSPVSDPDFALAEDINGDGFADLIFFESNHDTVAIRPNGDVLFTLPYSERFARIGQVDADPALELVFEHAVYDMGNLASVTLEWSYPSGFGNFFLADYDHDGMEEIIAEKFNAIRFYDVDLLTETSVFPFPAFTAFHVFDVDSDGDIEILTTFNNQPAEMVTWDALTMLEESRFFLGTIGAPVGVVEDFDQDGNQEVLMRHNGGFQAVDWSLAAVEWESVEIEGPFVGAELGDLDGDGIAELVSASTHSTPGVGGRIVVLDPVSGALLGMSLPAASLVTGTSDSIQDLRLRDMDHDGEMEILIATDADGHGLIEVYSFSQGIFTLDWTNIDRPYQSPLATVDAADLDGDGVMEIMATVLDYPNTLVDDNYLYVFDYATGLEKFRSAEMGTTEVSSPGLEVGDFDHDGTIEVAAMVLDGSIYIYDGPSLALEAILPGQHRSLSQFQFLGQDYLMAGTTPGDVAVYSLVGSSYQWVFSQYIGNSPVDAGQRFQVGSKQLLMSLADGTVSLTPFGSSNILWQTGDWGDGFAKYFHFALQPSPGFYATSLHGLHRFSRP